MSYLASAVVLLALGTPAETLLAQKPRAVPRDLVDRLQSQTWSDRARALNELLATGDADETERRELVRSLLARERVYLSMTLKQHDEIGERYSDPYYSTLLEAALKAFRTAPTPGAFEELMKAHFNAASSFALSLSDYETKYPQILDRLQLNSDSQYVRLNAAAVALHARSKGIMSISLRKSSLAMLERALSDSSAEVRVPRIFLLSRIEGDDVHQLLLSARKKVGLLTPPAGRNELERLDDAIERTDPVRRK